jgi:type IV secretion system protein TrbL
VNDGLLDSMVALYGASSATVLARIVPFILPLHVSLFTVQFGWDLLVWTLAGTERAFAHAARKLLVFLVSYGAIILLPLWLAPLLRGWEWLGEQASGLPGLSPSGIFDQGISLGLDLFSSWKKFASVVIPTVGSFRLVAMVVVILCFGLVALQLARILVEASIVLGGLPIMLAFAGHKATFGMAEGFFRYAMDLGVRTYVVFLIVGVGRDLGGEWDRQLSTWQGVLDVRINFVILLSAVFFALIVWTLPKMVADKVAGGFTFGGINPLSNHE